MGDAKVLLNFFNKPWFYSKSMSIRKMKFNPKYFLPFFKYVPELVLFSFPTSELHAKDRLFWKGLG